MKKGEATRQYIIEKTAVVFNCKGYGNARLEDIKAATGLEKGGLYRHFSSKEEMAAEAFDYAFQIVLERHMHPLKAIESNYAKLEQFISRFYSVLTIAGGCPVINTAIESGDANPALRQRAVAAYKKWQREITTIVKAAVEQRELRSDLNAEKFATFLLASLEGGLIALRLSGRAAGEAIVEQLLNDLRANKLKTRKR